MDDKTQVTSNKTFFIIVGVKDDKGHEMACVATGKIEPYTPLDNIFNELVAVNETNTPSID